MPTPCCCVMRGRSPCLLCACVSPAPSQEGVYHESQHMISECTTRLSQAVIDLERVLVSAGSSCWLPSCSLPLPCSYWACNGPRLLGRLGAAMCCLFPVSMELCTFLSLAPFMLWTGGCWGGSWRGRRGCQRRSEASHGLSELVAGHCCRGRVLMEGRGRPFTPQLPLTWE